MQYFMRSNLQLSRVKADVSWKKEAILSGVTVTRIVKRGVTVVWTFIRFERKKKKVKCEAILNSHKIVKTCFWFPLKNCPTYTISFNRITPQIRNNLISFIKTLSLLACGVDNFFLNRL